MRTTTPVWAPEAVASRPGAFDTCRVWPLRFAALLLLEAVACGPSFQAVYECDVHFEHCYALDDRPVTQDAKKECWRAWLHGYTYGQSRDRVDYAAARFSQLSAGPAAAPTEEPHDAPPPKVAVVAPAPTNAFAPPPNVAASAVPDASAPSTEIDAGPRIPAADCSTACAKRWTTCRETCDATTAALPRRAQGQKAATCDECDRAYRVCAPACFRDGGGSAHPASPHTLD
jgi:hypothetical protein